MTRVNITCPYVRMYVQIMKNFSKVIHWATTPTYTHYRTHPPTHTTGPTHLHTLQDPPTYAHYRTHPPTHTTGPTHLHTLQDPPTYTHYRTHPPTHTTGPVAPHTHLQQLGHKSEVLRCLNVAVVSSVLSLLLREGNICNAMGGGGSPH